MTINQNHYGVGDNIAGDKIINGIPQRHFSNFSLESKKTFDNIPIGTNIDITSVVDVEASNLADEIKNYLNSRGHKIDAVNRIMSADILKGVDLKIKDKNCKIMIGFNY